MKKLNLLLLLLVFTFGASALGQENGLPKSTASISRSWITVEDDATGNYLAFNPRTGNYKFFRCHDEMTMSGIGIVKIDGCAIYFEDVQDHLRVLASVNSCTQEGKAAVEKFPFGKDPFDETVQEYLSDKNLRDNTLSCAKKL